MLNKIKTLLGKDAEELLQHKCIFPSNQLHLPGPDFIERIMAPSDRPIQVLRNMQSMFDHGRLAGTGSCLFCQWIRELNTAPRRLLRRIPSISIRETS